MNHGFGSRARALLTGSSVALLTALVSNSVQAGAIDAAVKVGSLGAGLELGYTFAESNLSFRVQGNEYDYDYTLEEDDIEYDTTLDLSSVGLLLDWHPFGGAFRLTLGAYNHDNKINGSSSAVGEYEIGDETYTVTESDNFLLAADIELGDGIAPYAGIGWGHSPGSDSGLLLSFDIGVLAQGSPSVDLTATGTVNNGAINVGNDPTAQAEVQKEEDNLEDDLSQFDLYPVITLGIGYRF